MSGRPAVHSEASLRVLVVDGQAQREVFDVLGIAGNIIRARSVFLFELGEELSVRIERDGSVSEATVRVRAHTGPVDAPVTELEIADRGAPDDGADPGGGG
jgi:hypothetical protein